MANLNCGLFSFEFKYVASDGYGGYIYSLRIYFNSIPLFSERLDGIILPNGGTFIFNSDDEDKLLNSFELLISKSTPIDTEITCYAEIDSKQVIWITLLKRYLFENRCRYIINIKLDSDSFINCYMMGKMVITGITDSLDDLKCFVSKLKSERAHLKTINNSRTL